MVYFTKEIQLKSNCSKLILAWNYFAGLPLDYKIN